MVSVLGPQFLADYLTSLVSLGQVWWPSLALATAATRCNFLYLSELSLHKNISAVSQLGWPINELQYIFNLQMTVVIMYYVMTTLYHLYHFLVSCSNSTFTKSIWQIPGDWLTNKWNSMIIVQTSFALNSSASVPLFPVFFWSQLS